MCILIIKPRGQKLPSFETLKRCASRNRDGFGFATAHRLYKNLDFGKFYKELLKVPQEEACIIHMRFATHGTVKASNCHPFFDKSTGVCFAHNGVLPIVPDGDTTDSETAFRRYFVPTIKRHGLYSKTLKMVVDSIIGGSKFAFIDHNGDLRTFGAYIEHEGCYYSNWGFYDYGGAGVRFFTPSKITAR